ncbi:hypothetical protein ABT298_22935 [Streptomyces sp. NPDC001034]|uniref:hypothetical protein n=1 Tax=Streptomyces sp. NPDC001034 TaxID=3154375 RepID=UPI0033201A45
MFFDPVTELQEYTASKLMSQVGLRVSEACRLDLADTKWDLGRFGKLHVRHGKGARGSGPRERMVPLINGADRSLRWFIEDVWGQFDDDHEAIADATTPDVRLIVALAAVHAARPKMIRTTQLEDVDLGNRRITVGGMSARPTTSPAERSWTGSTTAAALERLLLTASLKRPLPTAPTRSTWRSSSITTRRQPSVTRTRPSRSWSGPSDTRNAAR